MDILFLRLVLKVKFTISRACWLQGILGKLCRQWQNGHNRHLNPKGSVKYKFTRLQHIISKRHSRANFVEKKYSDLKPNSQSSKNHCEKKQIVIPFYIIGKKRLADKKFADCSANQGLFLDKMAGDDISNKIIYPPVFY